MLYVSEAFLSHFAKKCGFKGYREFKFRFMRLGLHIDAISDPHMMKMNSALVDEEALVIGISISGKTEEIQENLSLISYFIGSGLILYLFLKYRFIP